jgi:hypothetical protein
MNQFANLALKPKGFLGAKSFLPSFPDVCVLLEVFLYKGPSINSSKSSESIRQPGPQTKRF